MDIRCANCRAPWDFDELVSLRDDPSRQHEDGWRLTSAPGKYTRTTGSIGVLECPCCPRKDGRVVLADANARDRSMAVQAIADICGDDLDGLAADLEDADFMFDDWDAETEGDD